MSKFFKLIINVLIAETAGVQKFRTSVLIIFCSIVVGILGLLCLMDLPIGFFWDKIKIFLPESKKQNKDKEAKNAENGEEDSNKNDDKKIKSSSAMIASEEEMLKRFRLAINQSKSRSRGASSAVTPNPVNVTPFQLNPIEEK
jgi:hypothetical protein